MQLEANSNIARNFNGGKVKSNFNMLALARRAQNAIWFIC